MRILVVEDDGLTAGALERGLTAEGYAVEVASDGVDGLHRAREFSYDAMILDLMLPGISGLAVCSELRAAGRDLPVLMLTALGDPADHTAGLDIGADDYIVKPFKFPVLLAHLRALLRRGPARLPAVLRNGGLALDPARHVCTRDGCILDLTPREFAVLRYLMSHACDDRQQAGTPRSRLGRERLRGSQRRPGLRQLAAAQGGQRGIRLAHRDRPGGRVPDARRHLMPGFPPLWRSSLRLRLTVAGSLAAAIFAIGGTVTITLYSRSLTLSAQHFTAETATAIASRITDQWLPDPIPMPTGPDVPRVQVLDARGSVVTGDPSSAGEPAMYQLPAGLSRKQVTIGSLSQLGGSNATVYAVRVQAPGGPGTVVAAMPLGAVAARVTEAIDATAGIGAGALVVVGAVAWLTAGRVLRPVERMRNRATAITASGDPSGRLPKSGTDELSKLAETLNAMLASIERSVERQRRFVADAAHELRTPLAGLTAALEIAQRHPGTAGDTLIGDLLAGHRRLSRTLNHLLVLAALDGRAQDKTMPVDLAAW